MSVAIVVGGGCRVITSTVLRRERLIVGDRAVTGGQTTAHTVLLENVGVAVGRIVGALGRHDIERVVAATTPVRAANNQLLIITQHTVARVARLSVANGRVGHSAAQCAIAAGWHQHHSESRLRWHAAVA